MRRSPTIRNRPAIDAISHASGHGGLIWLSVAITPCPRHGCCAGPVTLPRRAAHARSHLL